MGIHSRLDHPPLNMAPNLASPVSAGNSTLAVARMASGMEPAGPHTPSCIPLAAVMMLIVANMHGPVAAWSQRR